MRLKVLALVLLAMLSMLIGCGKGPELVGTWRDDGSTDDDWMVQFRPDLTFTLVTSKRQIKFDGKYIVSNGKLSMLSDTAVVSGLELKRSYEIKGELRWQGEDTVNIKLVAPGPINTKNGPDFVLARSNATLPVLQGKGTSTVESSEALESKMCIQNVKALQEAMLLYAEDSGGLPLDSAWMTAISNTRQTIDSSKFSCPSLSKSGGTWGYAYNSTLQKQNPTLVESPAIKPLIFEANLLQPSLSASLLELLTEPRHNKSITVGFLDGHVSSLSIADAENLKSGRNPSKP